jgi:DNA-binding SARP family transcriptional activator/tetratricopeptide (TPR) repeat protein
VDELIATIWGESPPATAATALHGHVSRLRRIIGEKALRTNPGGYTLVVEPQQVDSGRFRALAANALAESSAEVRLAGLRDALSLWRGDALADFAYEPFAQGEIVALEELRMTSQEEAIHVDLSAGRHRQVLGELQALVRRHPLRERLWGQLMIALYRDGRQAEALAAYRSVRDRLVDDLGVEPGPELRELESAILRQDAELQRPTTSGRPAPTRARRSGTDDAEFVGRGAELDQLTAMLDRVGTGHTPSLVLITAEPGMGKSRLASRFADRVRDRVTVLTGRCTAEPGATFEPLRQILDQLPPDAAVVRVREALAGHEALPARIAEAATSRLFARLAQRRPVLLLVEDIHWAQPGLLDLLESISADTGAAVLTLCLARPGLAQTRPSFGERVPGATTVRLGRLPSDDLRQIVSGMADDEVPIGVIDEIVSVADGNPLFAVQLAAWTGDPAGPARSVPQAVRDLLTNRIGGLGPGELAVVQHAAIVGREFTVDALAALLPAESTLDRDIAMLRHRQLVHTAGDGYEFRHHLIHHTAYLTLDSIARARLHERYADWLIARDESDATVANEVIGYHLEQAHDSARAAGTDHVHISALARRAAEYLAAAGRSASARMDLPGAAGLFARALRLVPADDPGRSMTLLDSLRPLRLSGRTQEAMTAALDALDLARKGGDVVVEWRAQLELTFLRAFLTADRAFESGRHVAEQAIAALTPMRDHYGLTTAWGIVAEAAEVDGDLFRSGVAYRHARYHARRSPMSFNGGQMAWGLASVCLLGPTPIREAIRRCRELVEWRGIHIPGVLITLAEAHGLDGDFRQARAVVDQGAEIFREWGHRRAPIYVAHTRGRIELLAGDPVAAERYARSGLEVGASVGGDETDVDNALVLARALCQQRRFDEADHVIATYSGATSAHDVGRAAAWNGLRAQIRTHAQQWADAVDLARRAVAAADRTDLYTLRADLRLPLAAALRGCGDGANADRTLAEAVQLFEAKGNRVGLAAARDLNR